MEKEIIPLDTLLRKLDDSNYDSLILQEQMRSEGFIFHYIIDIDLIGNYCFPNGIIQEYDHRIKSVEITDEYLADEQVTLHALFHLYKNSHRVIVLDEYYAEFKNFIRFARINAKPTININDGLFDEETLNNLEKVKENDGLAYLIKSNLSKLIADVILQIYGLVKLTTLFKENVFIFDAEELENEVILEALEFSKNDSKRVLEIFDLFDTRKKEYTNEESKEIDAKGINRVLLVNEFLSRNSSEKAKHIFMCVGASNANGIVFEKLMSKDDYPLINGKRIKLYRTTNEFFAYLICRVYDDKGNIDSQKTIDNLSLLKKHGKTISKTFQETEDKIAKEKETNDEQNFHLSDEFQTIYSRYFKLRNTFENEGLFQSFELLYASITRDLDKQKFSQIQSILEKLKNQYKAIEKELKPFEERLIELDEENKINRIITAGFEEIKIKGEQFKLQKGHDLIEGSYQFLPLIFKIQNISKVKDLYKQPLNDLTNLIINKKTSESEQICSDLISLFKNIEKLPTKYIYPIEEKIIKTLVFLILPNSNEENTNRIFINWLIKSAKEPGLPEKLRIELWYILSWIYRRGKDYTNAIKYAEEGIKTKPEDPRFYHGRFLAKYCLWENNKIINVLSQIIQDMEISFRLYKPFIEENYDGKLKETLLEKISDSFYNNSCYFLTEMSYLLIKTNSAKSKELIQEARNDLKKLKRKEGKYLEELPEYFDTESNLEYVESFLFDDKIGRLNHALTAIKKAFNLSNHTELREKYKKREEEINNRLLNEKK